MESFVYILQCADETLYTGWTVDPEKRLAAHNAGKGSKFTRTRLPVKMIYLRKVQDERLAKQLEISIKKMTRTQKMLLIQQNNELSGG